MQAVETIHLWRAFRRSPKRVVIQGPVAIASSDRSFSLDATNDYMISLES